MAAVVAKDLVIITASFRSETLPAASPRPAHEGLLPAPQSLLTACGVTLGTGGVGSM